MKSKIISVTLTFQVDPELNNHQPFTVSGNLDITSDTDAGTVEVLSKLADSIFPLEQVQTSMSNMAQADLEASQQVEVRSKIGVDYSPKPVSADVSEVEVHGQAPVLGR